MVGVRAEEVALALDERRGQPLRAQAVVVRERRRERGRRDTSLRRDRDDAAPALLRARDRVAEVRGDDERDERGVVGVRLGDPVQEPGTPRDPNAQRVNNGISGDGRRSSAELGKRAFDMKIDYAVKQIRSLVGGQ